MPFFKNLLGGKRKQTKTEMKMKTETKTKTKYGMFSNVTINNSYESPTSGTVDVSTYETPAKTWSDTFSEAGAFCRDIVPVLIAARLVYDFYTGNGTAESLKYFAEDDD
jgi:hypothetical protein